MRVRRDGALLLAPLVGEHVVELAQRVDWTWAWVDRADEVRPVGVRVGVVAKAGHITMKRVWIVTVCRRLL